MTSRRHLPVLKLWKHRGAAATCAILSGVATVGYQVLPLSNQASSQVMVVRPGQANFQGAGSEQLPVFLLAQNGDVKRVGIALASASNTLNIREFDDLRSFKPEQPIPVLLRADVRLLWAITSDGNKKLIQISFRTVIDEMKKTLEQIANSETFKERYRAALQMAGQASLDSSIADPQVDQAIAQVLAVVDAAFDGKFVAEYSSAIARESAKAFILFLGDMRGILTGDIAPDLKERLKTVLDTPEGRQLIAGRMRSVLYSRETAELLTTFGRILFVNLIYDPNFLDELHKAASDAAFAESIQAIERSAVEMARDIAKLLVGVSRSDRMHPLAATIIRSLFFRGEASWIVAFVAPDQLVRLREAIPNGVITLEQEGK